MLMPAKPSPGKPIPASWGSSLIDYLRSITPRSSATVRVRTGAGGTTFETKGSAASARGLRVRGTQGLYKIPVLRAYMKDSEYPELEHDDDELVAVGETYNSSTMYLYLTWDKARM